MLILFRRKGRAETFNLISRTIGQGRLPRLLQRALSLKGVTVLMYHALVERPLAVSDWCFVDRDSFHCQMAYLKRHCRVVPLGEVHKWLEAREPAVALTFDDGFESVYTTAYPILQDLGMPATIFLVTGLIGSDETVWFCRLNEALGRTPCPRLAVDGQSYDLSTNAARRTAGEAIQKRLKRYPQRQLLERMNSLLVSLGEPPDKPIPPGFPYRMLDCAAIQAMAASGLIEFGAHTVSHAILSHLSPSDRMHEIRQSLQDVERLTGKSCHLFAYPNGSLEDFGETDKAANCAV
jgi:peptidoglycan/xylan/chitin deacetylase (PgdA/CDA1 family)